MIFIIELCFIFIFIICQRYYLWAFMHICAPCSIFVMLAVKLIYHNSLYLDFSASYQCLLHIGEIRALYLYYCLKYRQFYVLSAPPSSVKFGPPFQHLWCLQSNWCQNSLYLINGTKGIINENFYISPFEHTKHTIPFMS